MRPVLTPAEMAAVDAANADRFDDLVRAAGGAVARAALRRLGGGYGRRVTVVAGPGNNGADGRIAAELLRARGVRAEVLSAGDVPARLPPADLVIDAAFGTGLSRPWEPPAPGGPVLAVDVPSGLDGLTGETIGSPWTAAETVTFAALKTGLVLGSGPDLCGRITVADIDLDVGPVNRRLMTDDDVASLMPMRMRTAHKWSSAVRVIAGSPEYAGAGRLTAAAAQRAGAGMVVASTPGRRASWPVEAVERELPSTGWASVALGDIDRFGAVAIGPGLGTAADTLAEVGAFLARCPVPCVVDADAIAAMGNGGPFGPASRVVTPHDGEFSRLVGRPPQPDRCADVVGVARGLDVTLLLKGPTTIVAAPTGEVRLSVSGDGRLATAGTGDVLTGVIASFLAQGLAPLDAAGLGAHVHGRAGARLPLVGGTAEDVLGAIGPTLADLMAPEPAELSSRRQKTWCV